MTSHIERTSCGGTTSARSRLATPQIPHISLDPARYRQGPAAPAGSRGPPPLAFEDLPVFLPDPLGLVVPIQAADVTAHEVLEDREVLLGPIRVLDVEPENDPCLVAVVADLMLERVVEDQGLAVLPLGNAVSDPEVALLVAADDAVMDADDAVAHTEMRSDDPPWVQRGQGDESVRRAARDRLDQLHRLRAEGGVLLDALVPDVEVQH